MAARLGWTVMALLVVCATTLLAYSCRSDPRQRNYRMFTNMAYSPAYHADEPNDVFADGLTLRIPPTGTVARGAQPLPFGPDRDGYVDADTEMKLAGDHWLMPARFAAPAGVADTWSEDASARDAAIIARGAKTFGVFCTTCHGAAGDGDGPIAQFLPAVVFSLPTRVDELRDGDLYYIVTRGGRTGQMGSYASQVRPDERWAVIRYLRSLAAATAADALAAGEGGGIDASGAAAGSAASAADTATQPPPANGGD